MRINSNTMVLTKEQFIGIEDVIKRVAFENKISNVKDIQINISKDKGIVKFSIDDSISDDAESAIHDMLSSFSGQNKKTTILDEYLASDANTDEEVAEAEKQAIDRLKSKYTQSFDIDNVVELLKEYSPEKGIEGVLKFLQIFGYK